MIPGRLELEPQTIGLQANNIADIAYNTWR